MPEQFIIENFLILFITFIIKDAKFNMEFAEEEENFVKLSKITLDIVPTYLRKLFRDKWNMHMDTPWKSNEESGKCLIEKLPECKDKKQTEEKKLGHKFQQYIKKLATGNENSWDTTIIVTVMSDGGLKIFDKYKNDLEKLRKIRNEVFAHSSSMICSLDDFTQLISKVKSTAKLLFGEEAAVRIEKIKMENIETKLTKKLQQQLEEEKARNGMHNEMAIELEGKPLSNGVTIQTNSDFATFIFSV